MNVVSRRAPRSSRVRQPSARYLRERQERRRAYLSLPVCAVCSHRYDAADESHWLWPGTCNACGTDRIHAMVRRVVLSRSQSRRKAALRAIERLSVRV